VAAPLHDALACALKTEVGLTLDIPELVILSDGTTAEVKADTATPWENT
jgi:hypothetical protein